jgi:hypothetical protein
MKESGPEVVEGGGGVRQKKNSCEGAYYGATTTMDALKSTVMEDTYFTVALIY